MLDNKRKFASHLYSLLQRLSVSTYKQKNKYAEEIGISRQQLEVLWIIYDKGQLTMGELCKEISSACSTATDLADKLEKSGHLERIREKKDRRVVRLNILPKGEKLIKSVVELRSEKIGTVLEGFKDIEVINAIAFLEVLTGRMEKI